MAAQRTAKKPSPGLRVGWVLGAALLGVVAGVGMSFRNMSDDEDPMEVMEQKAVDLTPLGADLVDPHVKGDWGRPDPAALAGIPPYPNGDPRKLSSAPKGQGVPMAINWFSTPDSVETVVTYYSTYFSLLNQVHASHLYSANSGYVAWLAEGMTPDAGPGEGVLHMVSAIRQGEQTLVFLSATDPLRMVSAAAPELPPGVVLPPNASTPRVFELGEGRMMRVTLYSTVNGASLVDATDFYTRAFGQGAWTVVERNSADTRASLSVRRESTQQLVTLTKNGPSVDVMINYERFAPAAVGVTQ